MKTSLRLLTIALLVTACTKSPGVDAPGKAANKDDHALRETRVDQVGCPFTRTVMAMLKVR